MNPEKTERNKEIYEKWKSGQSIYKLADHYNIDHTTVYYIVDRWRKREAEGKLALGEN